MLWLVIALRAHTTWKPFLGSIRVPGNSAAVRTLRQPIPRRSRHWGVNGSACHPMPEKAPHVRMTDKADMKDLVGVGGVLSGGSALGASRFGKVPWLKCSHKAPSRST